MAAKQKNYNVRSRLINLEKMRKLILDALGDTEMTISEVASKMNIDKKRIQFIMLNMANIGMLNHKKNENLYLYYQNNPHFLQNLFYPAIDFSDRIKSIYTHTEEESNAHR